MGILERQNEARQTAKWLVRNLNDDPIRSVKLLRIVTGLYTLGGFVSGSIVTAILISVVNR